MRTKNIVYLRPKRVLSHRINSERRRHMSTSTKIKAWADIDAWTTKYRK